MIAHIFRKDLQRLWPWVVGVAAATLLGAILELVLGHFPADHGKLADLARPFMGSLAPGRMVPVINVQTVLAFFVIVMAVQLDPIPGERQDWLVRPIRRRDLLLAKLLFVAVAIHAPLLAIDLFQGLATGLAFGPVLAAALMHNIDQFLTISVAAMALAALTRNIGQMLALGFVMIAAVLVLALARAMLLQEALLGPDSTIAGGLIKSVFLLGAGAIILRLQYFRRATLVGRAVLIGAALLGVAAVLFVPQSAAFAFESWFAPRQAVSLAFAPQAGRRTEIGSDEVREHMGLPATVYLPVQLSGVTPDQMVVALDARVSLTVPGGKTVRRYTLHNYLFRKGGSAQYHLLDVPGDFLRAHGDEPVRVELEYVLAVLTPQASYDMEPDGGAVRIPGGPNCVSRLAPSIRMREGCQATLLKASPVR